MSDLKIGLVQFDIIWEKPELNFLKIESILNDSEIPELLILPEMFNTGFTMDAIKNSETVQGKTSNWMAMLSKSLKTTIMGTLPVFDQGHYYNRCLVFQKGQLSGEYNKRYLFTNTKEDNQYTAGKSKLTFELNSFKLSPLICYDLRFPKWCYNEENADLIIFMANWPINRINQWSALLKARAIENQCYVVGINRIGSDGNGLTYSGQSQVIDPFGHVILNANDAEGLFTVDLSKSMIIDFRNQINSIGDYFRTGNN